MSAFGLTALFEAMNSTTEAMNASDALFEAVAESIDDDVKMLVAGDELPMIDGDEDDELGYDMAGLGIDDEDEEKYSKLIAMIPEDDEGIDEKIDEVIEACIPDEI